MPLRFLNFVPLKMRYSCQGDVLLFYKREGDTIKKKNLDNQGHLWSWAAFWNTKALRKAVLRTKAKFLWSTRHISLFPLRKKENHATAGSAALCSFLKKKKKKDRGGCYSTQSLVTLVPWLLWNTELFNDANYKQRKHIRRICLEISLLDWKLASLIELAGLRFFSAEAWLGALVHLHYLTTQ